MPDSKNQFFIFFLSFFLSFFLFVCFFLCSLFLPLFFILPFLLFFTFLSFFLFHLSFFLSFFLFLCLFLSFFFFFFLSSSFVCCIIKFFLFWIHISFMNCFLSFSSLQILSLFVSYFFFSFQLLLLSQNELAPLAGAVEYTPTNESPRYDTKQSDSEVPVILELRRMQSTPSLPLLAGSFWPGMVAPDKGPIYGLNRANCIFMLNWIISITTVWKNWIAWNRNVFDK